MCSIPSPGPGCRMRYVLHPQPWPWLQDAICAPSPALALAAGSWQNGDKSSVFYSLAYLLDRGYAVVSVQYRLVCNGYTALDMLADLTDAYHYVQAPGLTPWPTRLLIHTDIVRPGLPIGTSIP